MIETGDGTDLKKEIKAEAARLGFSLIGFAQPEQPLHLPVYEDWIQAGRHGSMAYLASDRACEARAAPTLLMEECRSIMVAAIPYENPGSIPQSTDESSGRVAAYAWGDDYHEVLIPRLKGMVEFIEGLLGREVRAWWYTDTGPILERDLAQRAGLGWIGKNTCLINPAAGSYFLLAEVLLDVDLQPDPPFVPDLCGTCTRCIQACPTGCIRLDRTIDATRCISYLTIENKGPIPSDLRPMVGDWVFGCDICQQACPWNQRFAARHGDPAFAPRPEFPRPMLRKDIHLTAQEFNRKFKSSPVRRTKRRGYLRNITVALGNLRDQTAIPDLAKVLEGEPEALVRSHAAWALGQIENQLAADTLRHALAYETDLDVLEEIHKALEHYGSQAG